MLKNSQSAQVADSEEKKVLVYILHDLMVGGAEVALVSAIPELVKKFNLYIIVLGTINQTMIKHLSQEEKRVFIVFKKPLIFYPFFLPFLIRRILNLAPTLIICSFWRASIVGILLKKIRPKASLYSFNHSTRFPHFLSSFFTKLIGKYSDIILTDGIATTTFVHKEINPSCPVKEVSFITNPTPTSIKQKTIIKGDEIKVLFVGRINKVKNLPMIMRVIKDLREQEFLVTLDIYGRNDGDMKDVKDLIKEWRLDEVVIFKGEIPQTERFALFNNYHFYIQLSTFEGMAMSVVEAMQNGLVCIVSPVGEIPNYSAHMESAIFFDINDPSVWEKNINNIIDVINCNRLYENISIACHSRFIDKEDYSTSLIRILEQ